MRILSKFHDYYDGFQSLGQSDTIYKREEIEVFVKDWFFPFDDYNPGGKYINYGHLKYNSIVHKYKCVINKPYIIGFCGKIYPLQVLSLTSKDGLMKPLQEVFCYTIEDVDNFICQNFKKKEQLDGYRKLQKGWKYKNVKAWKDTRQYEYKFFFSELKKFEDYFSEMFLEKKSPIFVARRVSPKPGYDGKITWNAKLQDFGFFKVKDIHAAGQEIEMFLNNLSSPEKPIPQVSDEDLAFVKGFDKWSFRKEPKK